MKTCCGDEVMAESNWVMFRGIDTTSLPASSLKKVRFYSPRYSAFQFGNVSRIVEYPPAGQDSFCKEWLSYK